MKSFGLALAGLTLSLVGAMEMAGLVTNALAQISLLTAVGVLGMPGMTAYTGLLTIGAPKAGETVVVAAATGPASSRDAPRISNGIITFSTAVNSASRE